MPSLLVLRPMLQMTSFWYLLPCGISLDFPFRGADRGLNAPGAWRGPSLQSYFAFPIALPHRKKLSLFEHKILASLKVSVEARANLHLRISSTVSVNQYCWACAKQGGSLNMASAIYFLRYCTLLLLFATVKTETAGGVRPELSLGGVSLPMEPPGRLTLAASKTRPQRGDSPKLGEMLQEKRKRKKFWKEKKKARLWCLSTCHNNCFLSLYNSIQIII